MFMGEKKLSWMELISNNLISSFTFKKKYLNHIQIKENANVRIYFKIRTKV